MNRPLLTLAFLSLTGCGFCIGASPSVVVVDRQQQTTPIDRGDIARIELGNETVAVHKRDGSRIDFERSFIERINLGDPSAAEAIATAELAVSPRATHDRLTISGAESGERFMLFDMNGRACLSGTCTAEPVELSIGFLPKGFYILRVGMESFKIVRL